MEASESIASLSDLDSVVDLRSANKAVHATLRSQALEKTVKSCYLKISKRQYEGPKGLKVPQKDTSDSTKLLESASDANPQLPPSDWIAAQSAPSISLSFTQGSIEEIPSKVVKDVMIKRLREYDKVKRKLGRGSQEIGFDDSLASSVDIDDNPTIRTQPLPPLLERQSSILSTTHQSKLSSMVNHEHEYAVKWQHMRRQREQTRVKKEALETQKQLLLGFRLVAQQFERKVVNDSLSLQRDVGGDETVQLARTNKEKARTAHQLFVNRERKERARKAEEVQATKLKLESSIRAAKNAMLQEKDLIRQHVQSLRSMRLQSSFDYLAADGSAEAASSQGGDPNRSTQLSRSSTAGSVSSTNSFVVNIPWELTDKVKHAKSLTAYTAARKEVKDYQEQVYAEKLRAIAIQKHVAQKRAKSMGSPLRLNLLKASELFCDSQSSSSRRPTFDDTIASEDDSSLQLSIK